MLSEEAEYMRLLGELANVSTPFVEGARSLIEEVFWRRAGRCASPRSREP